MLDEGDAKNFHYDWQVAQSLCQPKAIRIRDVLVEHASNQFQLGCEGHKGLRVLEMFLKVSIEEALVLRKDRIEEVYHQQESLEGHILSILILCDHVWVCESHRSLLIVLILHRKNQEDLVK